MRQAVCLPDEPGQTYRTSQAKSATLRPTSDVWDPRKSLHRANGRHTVNGQALRSVLHCLSVTFLPVPNWQRGDARRVAAYTAQRVSTCPLYICVHMCSFNFRHLSTYIARSVQMDGNIEASQFGSAVKVKRRGKKPIPCRTPCGLFGDF